MKILVLAQPRSGSMWLTSMLSSHHGLQNLKEPYGKLYEKAEIKNSIDQWIQSVVQTNKKIESATNLVAKIESSVLYWKSQWFGLTMFNPQQYNAIYRLNRNNLTDVVCSMYLARQLQSWHYTGRLQPKTDIPPQILDPKLDKEFLLEMVRSELALDIASRYLTHAGIPFVDLEYTTLVEWVDEHLPKGTSHLVESKYNYQEIFTNYKDIPAYLDDIKSRSVFDNV